MMEEMRGNIISPYVTGRAGVFIDESNLFHSQRTLGWRIDFEKLYWLLRDLDLGTRNIFVYTSFLKDNLKQNKFINKLVEYGYAVHAKQVKEIRRSDGGVIRKGNLDIELALDAYAYSDIYDTFVLFSGDSDFAYLLDLLSEKGKNILVISTRGHISVELSKRSKFIDLDKLKHFIEYSDIHKTILSDGLGGTTSTIISK